MNVSDTTTQSMSAHRHDEKIQFVVPTPQDRKEKLVARLRHKTMCLLFHNDIVELRVVASCLADDLESHKLIGAFVPD